MNSSIFNIYSYLLVLCQVVPLFGFSQSASVHCGSDVHLNIGPGTFFSVKGDLNVDGNVSLQGYLQVSGDVLIYGDLMGNGELRFQNEGNVAFYCTDTIAFVSLSEFPGSQVSCFSDIYVSQLLSMGAGNLNLNFNTLTLGPGIYGPTIFGVIFGTETAGMLYNGAIVQHLTGSFPYAFPVGDGIRYRPIMVSAFANSWENATITIQSVTGPHPDLPQGQESIQSWWSIQSNILGDVEYSVSGQWHSSDLTVIPDLVEPAWLVGSEWVGPAGGSLGVQDGFGAADLNSRSFYLSGLSDIGPITIFYSTLGCDYDLDGNGIINTGDVVLLLNEFGCNSNCLADLNGDDLVGSGDLIILLAVFNTTCP